MFSIDFPIDRTRKKIFLMTIFTEKLTASLSEKNFIKLTLSKPDDTGSDLKNIYVRLVEIKGKEKLHFTYRYTQRDETKNFDVSEGEKLISNNFENNFSNADLFFEEKIFSFLKKEIKKNIFENDFEKKISGNIFSKNNALEKNFEIKMISKKNPDAEKKISLEHNTEKKRILNPSAKYFHALGITNVQGEILQNGQKKFKQIDKYIDIVSHLITEAHLRDEAVIADMGSGKGYLTFALYDYLTAEKKLTPHITGFELRPDLVKFCNDVAIQNDFKNLNFIAQDINDFHPEKLDMLIALHACDIATDIAIAKGIKAGAEIIIVAPCCHKQIRKEMDNVTNEMQPILDFGIMKERQAELITDGLRALIMQAHGYKTKMLEFISSEHTPKNVMITGIKSKPKPALMQEVERIKKHYGIKAHYLEKLLQEK